MKTSIDSAGELHFMWFCEELVNNGFIEQFHKSKTYNLFEGLKNTFIKEMKTKNKEVEETLLHPHNYTPDWEIIWENKAKNIFFTELGEKKEKAFISQIINPIIFSELCYNNSIIEIKPSYDFQNMSRLSVINVKWMMDKYNLFINQIQTDKLFKSTFTPKRYIKTDSGMANRTINKWLPKTLEQFLKEHENRLS